MIHKLNRSALMALARRYCTARMFDVKRLQGTMYTDAMDARCKSIHGEEYFQVFGNKELFLESYLIKRKADFHDLSERFVQTYGATYKLVYDGTKEQLGRNTKFQRFMRKYEIHEH